MIPVGPRSSIFLFTAPVDMRKAFDGLCGEIRRLEVSDPMSGHLFVFTNRARNRLKILYWDRHGFWLFYKRLEEGRFQLPDMKEPHAAWQLAYDQLVMILEGIDLSAGRRKRYSGPNILA